MIEILAYIDENGKSPFEEWFRKLNAVNAAKITTALYRMEQGNLSNAKSVGQGVHEYKVHFGPGFRVYFGRDGEKIIILLGGGTKKHQENDIRIAAGRWKEYKARKRGI